MKELLKNEYLAVSDVAGYLGISTSKVYQMVKQTDFPICRFDGVIRIPREALLYWLAQHTRVTEGKEGNK